MVVAQSSQGFIPLVDAPGANDAVQHEGIAPGEFLGGFASRENTQGAGLV
jgi:hypothetical protein